MKQGLDTLVIIDCLDGRPRVASPQQPAQNRVNHK